MSKHRGRDTWETQGGHIEAGETPLEAARRELYEESGAVQYEIVPLCDYCAGDTDVLCGPGGMVFAAEVFELGDIPDSEMQEVKTFTQLPDNLTYPAITPVLFAELEHTAHHCRTSRELVIDLHNYMESGSVLKRTAVRGIIEKNGKYLFIHSKYGDYKFPGGGMNDGETFEQTLVREVQEETGYIVDMNSILDGFEVWEKRKGHPEDLLIMNSYYFHCEVSETAGPTNLDDYEVSYDYRVSFMTLEDAIARNEAIPDYDNFPWIKRDTLVMKRLKQKQWT